MKKLSIKRSISISVAALSCTVALSGCDLLDGLFGKTDLPDLGIDWAKIQANVTDEKLALSQCPFATNCIGEILQMRQRRSKGDSKGARSAAMPQLPREPPLWSGVSGVKPSKIFLGGLGKRSDGIF